MLGAGEVLRGVVRAKAQTTFFAPRCQECWGQGKGCEVLSGLKPRLRFLSSVSGMLGQGKGCEVLSGLKPRLRVLSTVSEMLGAGEGLSGVARAKLNRPRAASVDSGGA